MKITVVSTKRDVAKGMKNVHSSTECVLGLAINRALKNAGIKEQGSVAWGGRIQVGCRTFRPKGLIRMPWNQYGRLSPEATKFLTTPRRFSFEYKGKKGM